MKQSAEDNGRVDGLENMDCSGSTDGELKISAHEFQP